MQSLQHSLRDPIWRRAFRQGQRDITGAALGSMAMGLVTGVAMAKSGMGLGLILAVSLLVFASASQLACLPLIAAGAPLWVIAATACVLNLRFIGMLALLALALPMLTDRSVCCSALLAGIVAMATASWPMGLNVVAAIAAAVLAGLWADRYWKVR